MEDKSAECQLSANQLCVAAGLRTRPFRSCNGLGPDCGVESDGARPVCLPGAGACHALSHSSRVYGVQVGMHQRRWTGASSWLCDQYRLSAVKVLAAE